MTRIRIISYALILLAFFAWGALAWATSALSAAALASASNAVSAQQAQNQLSYQKRIAALALDTKTERDTLERAAGSDVVAIVNALENSDPSGKLGLKVNDAQQEGTGVTIPGGTLNEVSFLVEATGSFQALMREISALEHLPLPSLVEQVELGRLTGQGARWHLSAHVRLYTTAPISSS